MMISNRVLFDFCASYRDMFGMIQDETRFQNELGLRFYHHGENPSELLQRCIDKRLVAAEGGNIIIRVGGKKE